MTINTTLTADIIAKASVVTLDNELVMAKQVFRGYEEDVNMKVNGYEVGETISIRKPTDYTVRTGAIAVAQDTIEGKTTLSVDRRYGVDFKFTAQELTLDIKDLTERAIKPAMIQLANQVDADLHQLYKAVPNWVGTPGQLINGFPDFVAGLQRMDEGAVPKSERTAVLSPADHWALVGSQTNLYNDTINKPAYRQGETGKVGGAELFATQNVATHTVGTITGNSIATVDLSITASTITYSAVKDTMTQTMTVDNFSSSTPSVAAGDVFTIEGVYDVNPVTKAPLPFLKMFTVVAAVTGSSNEVTFTMYPAMIWTGAFKNVDVQGVSDLNGQDVLFQGTASANYSQNMIFNRNAFALVMVPLISPPGAVDVGRQTYKGTSVRVIPVYDGINDASMWRLDILFGVKAVDPRRAVRLSGAAG